MKIYLASSCAHAEQSPVVRAFREIAARNKFEVHKLADYPESADLILFVDNRVGPKGSRGPCWDARLRSDSRVNALCREKART